ncbi:CTLH/CRA C-terminal to lish motif domain-containing protein [Rhodocollybia butyracea]|uniref:CTLH/CRA C-terminal to lish motif domain-containing protein n=1 Tax=Rhodocollybia butyracea TaxID=206335 RepID=A0A9P5Q4B6_9AGAR|nr:CTLH/CRA C-terminal to lish motif domain-containing protein [Rhodocollybia butyracea]
MSSRPELAELQATPVQLRSLVLEYLAHSGYTNSARAFIRDSAVRHINIDGDEAMEPPEASGLSPSSSELLESTLKQAELRKQIRSELLCGRISEATDLLNKYFPGVLSLSTPLRFEETLITSSNMDYVAPNSVYPAHLVLNLRIQAFVEACRTRPLEAVDDESVHTSKLPHSGHDTIDHQAAEALLKSARKLHALVQMLPSKEDISRYMKELECVLGLLAYRVPEDSPVSEYLSQDRREAVADQIDHAILYHAKRPVISYLELYARYTSTILGMLHSLPSGMVNPPASTKSTPIPKEKQEVQEIPPFDFHAFVTNTT